MIGKVKIEIDVNVEKVVNSLKAVNGLNELEFSIFRNLINEIEI